MKLKQFLFNLIFPQSCLFCGKTPHLICTSCLSEKIKFKRHFECPLCRDFSADNKPCESCHKEFNIGEVLYLLPYEDLYKKIIKSLKYKSHKSVGIYLAELLETWLKDKRALGKALWIPAPSTKASLSKRGYWQLTEILDRTNLICVDALKKAKSPKQASLNDKERRNQIRGKISISKSKLKKLINASSIVIFDDVSTTCSTLLECYKVIREINTKSQITCIVLARPKLKLKKSRNL